jgi:hypothetical protein
MSECSKVPLLQMTPDQYTPNGNIMVHVQVYDPPPPDQDPLPHGFAFETRSPTPHQEKFLTDHGVRVSKFADGTLYTPSTPDSAMTIDEFVVRLKEDTPAVRAAIRDLGFIILSSQPGQLTVSGPNWRAICLDSIPAVLEWYHDTDPESFIERLH